MFWKRANKRHVDRHLRLPPFHQPLQLPSPCPDPFPEFRRHGGVIATIDLPPQGGALQGTGAEVEGEGNQGIKLPIGKRHGDKAQNSAFGGLHILAQQGFGLFRGDAAGEPFPLLQFYHMAIADGGIAGWADVHGG